MTNRKLLAEYKITDADIEEDVRKAMGDGTPEEMRAIYEESIKDFKTGTVLKGKIVKIFDNTVILDVGYKSEGVIMLSEFDDPGSVDVGDDVQVLLEAVEDDAGLIVLSKRKADRIRAWERIIENCKEDDVVRGRVMRKIKGGLLVDIGVPVFLPASQVNIRRVPDIGEYLGTEIECKILKIDQHRRNIVVSRRKLLEEERETQKKQLLEEIEVGELRKGVVKNIADFGAFIDLGGIDGLLHITDMSWGRISHPSEMVAIEQEIEVVILNVDQERERIALGLKQQTPSPWDSVEEKYPVGSKVKGEVVNIVPYGAFVKLEEGIEGLVHISEMSWTRRIGHPSELVAIGDMVEVVVLDINKEKHEISLGMKQTEANPWEEVEKKYPPETVVQGRVRNLTNYGAFIELEEGIEGLLHLSDMSWTKRITKPSDVVRKGEKVEAVVLSVDPERKRVALGLKQLLPDPWENEIPEQYKVGDLVRGEVTKITNFGVFVEIKDGLEGLLHISEISEEKIEHAEEVLSVGQEVCVKIIRVDTEERKIGLSMRRIDPEEAERMKGEYGEAEPVSPDEAPSADAVPAPTETEAASEQPAVTHAIEPEEQVATPDTEAVDSGSEEDSEGTASVEEPEPEAVAEAPAETEAASEQPAVTHAIELEDPTASPDGADSASTSEEHPAEEEQAKPDSPPASDAS
jgi:small subunit ribosomal protein S1